MTSIPRSAALVLAVAIAACSAKDKGVAPDAGGAGGVGGGSGSDAGGAPDATGGAAGAGNASGTGASASGATGSVSAAGGTGGTSATGGVGASGGVGATGGAGTGGTGATGGSGGIAQCPTPKNGCETCWFGKCCNETTACWNDAECSVAYNKYTSCSPTASCAVQAKAAHPTAASKLDALLNCVNTQCVAPCGVQCAHSNGLGQQYGDCANANATPGNAQTYKSGMATKAAGAWNAAACNPLWLTQCGASNCRYCGSGNSCAMWCDSGPLAGRVFLDTTATCGPAAPTWCPDLSDPTWD